MKFRDPSEVQQRLRLLPPICFAALLLQHRKQHLYYVATARGAIKVLQQQQQKQKQQQQ